ncbi:MAG: hypothetical protein COW24_03935 [Candidatus Kerfeldbacteria bacterium CG15_BIG_FIL_POST_REV_8_21_14_020_45_12]|uniref:UDP-N-acetylmuramoyl-L-alanyl-D-glutamate--2, 6-diaminopimelate ligase n=1 Tax=Candidatus Kerfeldbacteria bacterium CG15_BIG_FIL_POST_REV_8_21_14_020_45_12 TaxID=2014247 RepID=A0A2M7H382_9BACT|nr:MAG: hypothetical protein COW24_03935 [Candidatus Kerfeldbacteria bacterium CG15_BIG_FIL_POST_REV_8_21_14_020_45_12]PJA93837.1 MAG: hypothetical protein CO132_01080 [Candidatus Kerfeldbacteria bacterium CG_4_9_14_3_um_filter_45_8]
MFYRLKELARKLTPSQVMDFYYRAVAWLAAVIYQHPSRKMIVIGVTGTKGKSTTSNILWKILTDAGHTVGVTGTINFRIGNKQKLNDTKMTMLGRFRMQRLLREMWREGCDVAVVETTSEGIKQYRHSSIHFDVCAFTNISPEHLESHGGFDNYKAAKLKLFTHLSALPSKVINGKKIEKASVINTDSDFAEDFLAIGDHLKVRVGTTEPNDIYVTDIREQINGTEFQVDCRPARIPLLGKWNVMNTAMAMGIGSAVGINLPEMIDSVAELEPVPGRMEFVDEGQDYAVIVDYAYEPVSLRLLYEFCRARIESGNKLITLISSTGGGRDVGRRAPNGQVAGELCDYVIVTDEDPYDDDPQVIIDMVAEGVLKAGKVEGETFWRVLDRSEAIVKACALAKPGDVVILTAKGAEQKMCLAGGKKINWDDREVAREAMRKVKMI